MFYYMTKKIIAILATTLISCLSVNAQFSVSGVDNIIGVEQDNIDTVLVAEKVDGLLLKYEVEEPSTINWYTYAKDAEELSLVKTDENVTESTLEALPEASIGYVIKVSKYIEDPTEEPSDEPSVDEVEALTETNDEKTFYVALIR